MTAKELIVKDIKDWDTVANLLLAEAGPIRKIVLQGEIGAGKTTLVQAFARVLGIKEEVTSPTFSLVNEYTYSEKSSGEFKKIYHLDLYRLKNQQEALNIGIQDYLDDEYYCFIEWPEIIEDLLQMDILVIKIIVDPDTTRKILFL